MVTKEGIAKVASPAQRGVNWLARGVNVRNPVHDVRQRITNVGMFSKDRADDAHQSIIIVRKDLVNGWGIRRYDDQNRNLRARVDLLLEGSIVPFVYPLFQVGQYLSNVSDSTYALTHPALDLPFGFLVMQSIVGAAAGYVLGEGWDVPGI